ncbi:MAG TPA: hypothetical protein PKY56_01730 [Candidatus Kapabacteria bacterium]|nr:hypothetical protein [Candidatus Kapabacteria bacterium]HPO62959.1 hypothetical protein [Candidatus Kapabacteria bacterium]
MKFIFKICIIYLFVIFSFSLANAQEKSSQIKIDFSFFGNDYYINGVEYSKGEIADILDLNESTQELISSYSSKKLWGYICLGAGVILTGSLAMDAYATSQNSGTSPFNSTSFTYPFVANIGLDIIGLMLIMSSNKTFIKAIDKYNKNLQSSNDFIDFKVGFNRVALQLHF